METLEEAESASASASLRATSASAAGAGGKRGGVDAEAMGGGGGGGGGVSARTASAGASAAAAASSSSSSSSSSALGAFFGAKSGTMELEVPFVEKYRPILVRHAPLADDGPFAYGNARSAAPRNDYFDRSITFRAPCSFAILSATRRPSRVSRQSQRRATCPISSLRCVCAPLLVRLEVGMAARRGDVTGGGRAHYCLFFLACSHTTGTSSPCRARLERARRPPFFA